MIATEENNKKGEITELCRDLLDFETKMLIYFKKQEEITTLLDTKLTNYSKINPYQAEILSPNWPYCKKGLHTLLWSINNTNLLCNICNEKSKSSFWSCLGCKQEYCSKCCPLILI